MNLTYQQRRVLTHLASRSPRNTWTISNEIGRTYAHVYRVLRGLELHQLVERRHDRESAGEGEFGWAATTAGREAVES